jgi:predicted acylesterase/phospholipase RssA
MQTTEQVATVKGITQIGKRPIKRAIALGGGGPAAGLHIGILDALEKYAPDIAFDVWSLSCIGAWVGIVYSQCEGANKADQTHKFFKDHVFRDDESYSRFPINSVFGTNWLGNSEALWKFITDPANYRDIWLPHRMIRAFTETVSLFSDPTNKWDLGDLNGWIPNQVLAPNPFVRYLASMMYLSDVNGLSRINYPDSRFMKRIHFERLYGRNGEKVPFIVHNAFDLDNKELVLFANGKMKSNRYRGDIGPSTLCACSALPFVEETVDIKKVTYCEGALVDTLNFEDLLEEHPDLDEIWVCRIVDRKQIHEPKNLHDALANLCQLFAATVGEDDVKLFKYHIAYENLPSGKKWNGTVVEIHVPHHIDFKWNHSNLDKGRELGSKAAVEAINAYKKAGETSASENGEPRFINVRSPRRPSGEGPQLAA